jgi:hypothetical protein
VCARPAASSAGELDLLRTRELSLFLLVFLAHAYFASATGWNQTARIAAIFTFVEPGPDRLTLRIDGFVSPNERNFFTGDWAQGAGGQLYSNKAPGVSMLGVPAYAALYGMERIAGVEPRSAPLTRVNAIALNLWCSVFWTAAATVVLFRFLSALGLGSSDATLGALAYAFGTLIFPYDTSIWGHTTAAACLLVALCLASWPGGARLPWLAGLLGGSAVLIEYVAVFPLAAVGLVLLSSRASWRQRIAFGAGAALPLLVLLLYHEAVFGDYLVTASSRSNPVFLERAKAFGLLGPIDPAGVFGLLLSRWRGLFLYSPVLLFAFAGGWQAWREGQRMRVVACAAGFAACVLFVSSIGPWWGGWANGPRYLIVVLPLLAIFAPRTGAWPPWTRRLYHFALALSVFNMLALTAVEVMGDEADHNPLYGATYRMLFSGDYPQQPETFNLGMLLGLEPRWDLVPFLLVFGLWAAALLRGLSARSAPT